MKVAITGGIGSGKSYICRKLEDRGIRIFDCDSSAKYLMRTDVLLQQQLTTLIGADTFIDGQLNKTVVAQFLLQGSDHAYAIDSIVHPAVARCFVESGLQWMECAILYESGFDRLVDRVIVVSAPQSVRVQRVMQRDHISETQALQWMEHQWTQDSLLSRADYEIVNDGIADLDKQIDKVLQDIIQLKNKIKE